MSEWILSTSVYFFCWLWKGLLIELSWIWCLNFRETQTLMYDKYSSSITTSKGLIWEGCWAKRDNNCSKAFATYLEMIIKDIDWTHCVNINDEQITYLHFSDYIVPITDKLQTTPTELDTQSLAVHLKSKGNKINVVRRCSTKLNRSGKW